MRSFKERPPIKQFVVYNRTATETEIRKAILEYLRYRGYVCKRNNSGFMFIAGPGGKKRGINIGEAGWPDIEGMTKAGLWFGVEVKKPGQNLKPAQEAMQERILRSKGVYILARSVQDVIEAGL